MRGWQPGSYAVYVLDRAANDEGLAVCQVTGIWRECDEGYTGRLWYSTSVGEVRPCSHGRLVEETRPELVSELMFEVGRVAPRVSAA